MKIKKITVKITFFEEVLGTLSNNQDVYREFIASKSPDATTREEEIAAIGSDDAFEKLVTVFPKMEDGTPFFYDYQWKGYFKDSCSALNRLTKRDPVTGKKLKGGEVNESGKLKAFKKIIDGLIFVEPRKIPIHVNGEIGMCQRPLRAATAQGERIGLAASETAPAGSTCEFSILCLQDDLDKAVYEWLNYGKLRGTGQWRNSGKGKFKYEVLSEEMIDMEDVGAPDDVT